MCIAAARGLCARWPLVALVLRGAGFRAIGVTGAGAAGCRADVVPLTYDPKLRIDPGSRQPSAAPSRSRCVCVKPVDLVWLSAKNLSDSRSAARVILGPQEETVAAGTVQRRQRDRFAIREGSCAARARSGYGSAAPVMVEASAPWACSGSRRPGGGIAMSAVQAARRAARVSPRSTSPIARRVEADAGGARGDAGLRQHARQAERATAPGWREVSFQRTPPLPSYLAAFAVGAFDVRDGGKAGQGRTPISIITPKGRAARGCVRRRQHRRHPRRNREIFRQFVPVPEARPPRLSESDVRRRDGKPGAHHVHGADPAGASRRVVADLRAALRRHSPRTRSLTCGSATT